jgi:hypothetical protein
MTLERALQSLKESRPIIVVEEGMPIDESDEQSVNAPSSIDDR